MERILEGNEVMEINFDVAIAELDGLGTKYRSIAMCSFKMRSPLTEVTNRFNRDGVLLSEFLIFYQKDTWAKVWAVILTVPDSIRIIVV
jgi:hypothetical protein